MLVFDIFYLKSQLKYLYMLLSFQNWITVNALRYGLPHCVIKKLQLVQNSAARLITCCRKYDHTTPLLIQLHWLPISQRIWFKVRLLTFKAIHKLPPVYLQDFISKYSPSHKLRSSDAMLLERRSYNLKTYG